MRNTSTKHPRLSLIMSTCCSQSLRVTKWHGRHPKKHAFKGYPQETRVAGGGEASHVESFDYRSKSRTGTGICPAICGRRMGRSRYSAQSETGRRIGAADEGQSCVR